MKAEGSKNFLNTLGVTTGDSVMPLFPLGIWLYPTVVLPLQIFEPRYLSMISQRLKQGAGFGVVPIRDGSEVGNAPSIFPTGVSVDIVDWYQQSNGLLGIKVQGGRRFRVLDTMVNDDQLMWGQVAYLDDEEAEPLSERHNGLLQLLQELKNHPHAEALALTEPNDVKALSYQLAQLLPFTAAKKMALLAADDPETRLSIIAQEVFDLANA